MIAEFGKLCAAGGGHLGPAARLRRPLHRLPAARPHPGVYERALHDVWPVSRASTTFLRKRYACMYSIHAIKTVKIFLFL